MKTKSYMKWAAGAVMAMAALAGPINPAQALTFNAGDAVLVIYGGTTEYYQNLGSEAALIGSPSTVVTIDSSIMSQLGSTATMKYTIIGANSTSPNFISGATDTFEGTVTPSTNTSAISGWTSARNGAIDQSQYVNTLLNWRGQIGTIAGTSQTLGSGETNSFTNMFGGTSGVASLNGAFPRVMASNLDATLYLLGRAVLPAGTTTPQSALGSGLLTILAGTGVGQLTFTGAAPVPVPAAVILFGSGLIGLAGLARRARA